MIAGCLGSCSGPGRLVPQSVRRLTLALAVRGTGEKIRVTVSAWAAGMAQASRERVQSGCRSGASRQRRCRAGGLKVLSAATYLCIPPAFYGSASRGEGVYLAGRSLGKLLRTSYLGDYFTLTDFRHAIHWVLECGESVHALQRST
jgi:hypothetical protein